MITVYKTLESALTVLQGCSHLVPVQEVLKIFDKEMEVFKKGVSGSEGHTRSAPFIVFEGLDGSGKSTISRILADELEAEVRKTPPLLISGLRAEFDEMDEEVKRAFYAVGNYLAGKEVESITQNGTPVVMDRFWHSTAAYNLGNQLEFDVESIPDEGDELYEWPKDLVKPDIVLFLDVDEDTRRSRMSRRKEINKEELELGENVKFRTIIATAYKRMMDPKPIIIDSNLNKHQVVQICMNEINKCCPYFVKPS